MLNSMLDQGFQENGFADPFGVELMIDFLVQRTQLVDEVCVYVKGMTRPCPGAPAWSSDCMGAEPFT
jgi:hypothetical protein